MLKQKPSDAFLRLHARPRGWVIVKANQITFICDEEEGGATLQMLTHAPSLRILESAEEVWGLILARDPPETPEDA